MSQHRVEVVELGAPTPHPNADRLEIFEIFGYTCCAAKGQFKAGDRAAYIPPDSIVDSTRPEFAFLAGHERVRVKKLRGVVSMGLLMPTDAEIGADVMEAMGVKHYEPPIRGQTGGEAAPAPSIYAPCYDVESARRYGHVFVEGEPVIVTEKIHGANGRWVFDGERLHAGSRTEWKREGVAIWWQALERCPWLGEWLRAHPKLVVYGEVFGQVQDLKYGRSGLDVAVFDILEGSRWLDAGDARRLGYGLHWVPTLSETEWRWPEIAQHAEGRSKLADHVREGCVVKPLIERTHQEIGRVQAKLIGNGYLERA